MNSRSHWILAIISTISLTSALPARAARIGHGLGLDNRAIIGGTEVQTGDPVLRSTVLIVAKEDRGTSICTGSIIDKDLVLTAAHCIGIYGQARAVVAFRTSVSAPGPVIAVADRRRPSDFLDRAGRSPYDWHDIAVLKLAQPIPAGYAPATMLPDPSLLKTGETVLLAGYGMTVPVTPEHPEEETGAGTLRKVEQVVLDPNHGETEFRISLANGRGACHGDSGGPAFVRSGNQLYLVGVASRMTEADRIANNGNVRDFSCSVDMVYTNALKQAEWIREASRQLHGGQ